ARHAGAQRAQLALDLAQREARVLQQVEPPRGAQEILILAAEESHGAADDRREDDQGDEQLHQGEARPVERSAPARHGRDLTVESRTVSLMPGQVTRTVMVVRSRAGVPL